MLLFNVYMECAHTHTHTRLNHRGVHGHGEPVSHGHLDMVRCLVEAGAGLNQAMNSGGTPLAVARAQGHNKVAVFLERAGATE